MGIGKGNLLKCIAAASLILVLGTVGEAPAAAWQMITPQRVLSLMKEGSGMWLVDVRPTAAFNELHIEGAMNIPASIISTKRFPKQKMIVLADDSLGLKNARSAADQLVANGQEKIYVLDGGMYGWKAEGYSVAGMGGRNRIPVIAPEELLWAREHRVPLRIIDVREKDERERSPVTGSIGIDGINLPARLGKVRELLVPRQKKPLTAKLEKAATAVILLPIAFAAGEEAERLLYDLPADVRFLEGGHAAWMAKPDKKIVAETSCPVCPGGKTEGVTK